MNDPVVELKALAQSIKTGVATASAANQASIASLKAQLDEVMGVESKNEALKLLAEGVDLLVKGEQFVAATPTATWKQYAYAAAGAVVVIAGGITALVFHWI